MFYLTKGVLNIENYKNLDEKEFKQAIDYYPTALFASFLLDTILFPLGYYLRKRYEKIMKDGTSENY